MNGQLDPDVYDEEAFIGTEEGEIDGNVIDDLNDEDAEAFEEDEDEDEGDPDVDIDSGSAVASDAALAEERRSFRDNGAAQDQQLSTVQEDAQQDGSDDEAMASARHAALPDASIWTSRYHSDAVMAVAWSRDGQQLATGSCDDSAYLHRWQAKADQPAHLASHKDTVAAIAFAPFGALVATGGMDGAVHLWHTENGQHAGSLEGPTEPIVFLQWHPKGSVLLAGSEDMMAWMFNADKRFCMHVFSGHSGPVVGGAAFIAPCGFTPDGRTIVTVGGEADGSVRVWDPKSGECSATIAAGHSSHSEEGATCLAFADDGAVVATGGIKGEVVLSNVSTGKPVACLSEHSDSVEGVAFAHGLQLLASASLDGSVIIWDVGQHMRRGSCKHPAGVVSIAVQHSGPLFATACLDGAVRVFDVRNAELLVTYGGHEAPVQAVAWAPDDKHVMSGSDDHTARIFAHQQ